MSDVTATIYARQSLDKRGDELAVARQLEACRAFCAEHGWTVAEEIVDNDRSATSTAERPGFERLLLASPRRVVVWHVDRLVRLTRDLERVIDTGMNVHAVKAGHLDLSNPAGRAVARTITAWATYEGEQKAERQRVANRQRAARGAAQWSRRPFGFERVEGRAVIVVDEAKVIQKATERVLAGETLKSIADDLNARGVTTSTGTAWAVTPLKRVLLNPRNVGRVVYKGEDMGRLGPVILEDDTYERLRAKLTDPRRRNAPSTQVKHLLSGLARCSECDAPMFATNTASKRVPKYGVYRCLRCSRARRREYVDALVEGVILARLARPDASSLLSAEVDVLALAREADTLRDRRDGLAAMLAEGLMSEGAVREQARKLQSRINELAGQVDAATSTSPLAPLVGTEDVRAAWEGLTVLHRRAVIDALMIVWIEAAGKGARFTPEQVRIEWRTA